MNTNHDPDRRWGWLWAFLLLILAFEGAFVVVLDTDGDDGSIRDHRVRQAPATEHRLIPNSPGLLTADADN